MRGTGELPICLQNLRISVQMSAEGEARIDKPWVMNWGPPNSVVYVVYSSIIFALTAQSLFESGVDIAWTDTSDPAYFDAVNFSTKWHGFHWILRATDILGIAIGWHMRLKIATICCMGPTFVSSKPPYINLWKVIAK